MSICASAATVSPRDVSCTADRGRLLVGGRIALRGITAVGHHGVFDLERAHGQRFVVDVVCSADLSAAAVSDDLSDTVDYGTLAARIAADIEGEPLNLIEALANRIGRTCLAEPRVTEVEVTVHKPDVPMPVSVSDVAVTLTLTRSPDREPRQELT